jgi:transcriptional regulator with XRE-family HTH domain
VAEALGKRLKIALEKLGVTQQELAEKIGFTQSYISKILNGAKIPSSRFFDVISLEAQAKLYIQRLIADKKQRCNTYSLCHRNGM